MEIQKTNYTVSTAKSSKKKRKSNSSFAEALSSASETFSSHETSSPSSIININSILSLQEVSIDEEKRRQGKQYGNDLLSELEEMRTLILTGNLPINQLTNLEQKLKKERPNINDIKLNQILNEIELRVKVEIAKYKKYHATS